MSRVGENRERGEDKGKWPFSVSFSSILALLFLGAAAAALAYIGGVMSGRRMGADLSRAPVPSRESPAPERRPEGALDEILAAEDLEFARVLRGEQRRSRDKAEPVAEKPAESEQNSLDSKQNPAKNEPKPAETATPTEKPEPVGEKDEPRDYVFQAGAFRDETSADKLRQTFEGYGFRTRLEKKNKFFIVLIMIRGGMERVAEFMDVARQLKLGEPIPRGDSPAPSRRE